MIKDTKSYLYKKWIWIFIVLFVTVVIAKAITDVKMIYLGILLVPMLIYLSIEKPFIFPFGLYVLLLPFDSILSVAGNATGPTLTKFLGVLIILVLLLKGLFEKKIKQPDNASIWWIMLTLYGLLSILWAFDSSPVKSRLPTAIGLLSLYLIASSYKIKKSEFDTLKLYILAGGILSTFYGVYSYITGAVESSMRVSMDLSEERGTDPNIFAFSLLLPMSVCIERVLNQKRKAIKAMLIVALGIIIFGIVITGSRGGFLGVAAIMAAYILFMRHKTSIVITLLCVGIILVLFIPGSFIIERWSKAIETGGAGRTTIWYYGLKALEDVWVTGVGLNNFATAYSEFAHFTPFSQSLYRGAHNTYLEIFVELGIVGFTLLVLGLIKHYKAIKSYFAHYDSDAVMLRSAFWAVLVSSFFLGTFWTKSFWLLWMMILMFKNAVEKEVRNLIS